MIMADDSRVGDLHERRTVEVAQPARCDVEAPLLCVEAVSKAFGDRLAVNGVSFELNAGEMVAVLGPSGAGKTTLFRCMAALAPPDRGAVLFDGDDIVHLAPHLRRQIAVVFQDFNLVRRATAFQNVLGGRLGYTSAWRGICGLFERADQLKAFECLERVGLLDHAHQRADTLSGGQQQRVAIARALAQEPRLIVADEPVASLDPTSAAGVLGLLRDIARADGLAVVCSLHQVGYARAFCDRIIGLSRGRLVVDMMTADIADAELDALYAPVAAPAR